MKRIIFLLLISFCSCNKDDESHQSGANLDVATTIYVVDKSGEDLLNPENNEGFNVDNIVVYEVIDGQEVKIDNPNSDAPKGVGLLPPEGEEEKFRLNLTLNFQEKPNNTTTIIKWNDTEQDTIQAKLKRGVDFVTCETLWLNGEEVWDLYNDGGVRSFVIEK